MPARITIGTNINGFTVVSDGRASDGQIQVRCPWCQKYVWKHRQNLRRTKSCGCQRSKNIRRARALLRHRALVERAHAAFAADFRYGEQIAREATRIQALKDESSATM